MNNSVYNHLYVEPSKSEEEGCGFIFLNENSFFSTTSFLHLMIVGWAVHKPKSGKGAIPFGPWCSGVLRIAAVFSRLPLKQNRERERDLTLAGFYYVGSHAGPPYALSPGITRKSLR